MTAKGGFREQLRAAALENPWLKVISLATALGIYAFVHGAENAHRTFAVSVVSVQPPDTANRQLMTPLPTEVAVTLRASRTQLDDLRPDDLGSVQLDLRTGRESRVVLDESLLHVPPGAAIIDFNPKEIDVRWDDVIVRQIPIQVSRAGDLGSGFAIKSTTVEPRDVSARGPRSIVDVMQFARLAPFEVTGLTEGVYRRPLALDKPPKLVGYDVESVVATIEVARELKEKDYPNRKVEVVGIARATTVPSAVTVKITGTPEDLGGLLPEAIIPRVEVKAREGVDLTKPGSQIFDVLVDVGHRDAAHPPRVVIEPAKVLVKW